LHGAAKFVRSYDTVTKPELGFPEQVYCMVPLAEAAPIPMASVERDFSKEEDPAPPSPQHPFPVSKHPGKTHILPAEKIGVRNASQGGHIM
jgi:hypothetical protein